MICQLALAVAAVAAAAAAVPRAGGRGFRNGTGSVVVLDADPDKQLHHLRRLDLATGSTTALGLFDFDNEVASACDPARGMLWYVTH